MKEHQMDFENHQMQSEKYFGESSLGMFINSFCGFYPVSILALGKCSST